MQVSYGPPGHRGVSHLMAVGDVDDESHPLESLFTLGAIATAAALILGAPKPALRYAAGGVVALGIANYVRKKTRTAVVTRPL